MRRSAGGRWASWREWAAGGLLGEVTLVVAGRDQAPAPAMDAAAAAAEVAAREAAGTPRKEAIAAVAAESGLRKREVYNAVVAARRR